MERTTSLRATALVTLTLAVGFSPMAAHAQAFSGYTAPTGYTATLTNLPNSGIAISPSGLLAVASSNSAGGATVSIYDHVEGNRTLLKTISAPAGDTFKFFGGLTFADDNTFYFGENGVTNTVYRASLGTASPTVTKLAPNGSVPFVDGLALKSGSVYALSAANPGLGAVYQVSGGASTVYSANLGVGYLGGIEFAPDGSLVVGDTNDPNFVGNAGELLKIDSAGKVSQTISLANGGGSGLADFTFTSDGDVIASTGKTLTRVNFGATPTVSNFGTFGGSFPFPTGLTFVGSGFAPYSGTGSLYIGGQYTGVGGVFKITPTAVPEAGSMGVLFASTGSVFGLVALRRRRSVSEKKGA